MCSATARKTKTQVSKTAVFSVVSGQPFLKRETNRTKTMAAMAVMVDIDDVIAVQNA
jgi:hypothetical protein